jgi:ABC-type branched-subunit amino acid transport system substrate-binding protein
LRTALLLAPAIPLGLALCGTNQACTEEKQVVGDPPIVIGATVDLTKQKDFGAGSQRVLRVAEHHLNAVGGILGRRVILDVRDDGGDDKSIAGIGDDFIKKGVAGFVGPSTTDALEAMHGAFKDAKIPILAPFATSPRVPRLQEGRDRYLFRTSCAVEYQARALSRYALGGSFAPPGSEQRGNGEPDGGSDAGAPAPGFKACRKMAAIYAEETPGQGNATIEALKAEYTKFGGKLKDFLVENGAATYTDTAAAVIDAAKRGEVECQTMLMFPADGGKYMRAFRLAVGDDPAFSPGSFLSLGFIRFYQQGFIEAGRVNPKDVNEKSSVEGVIGAACNQERRTSPEWNRFFSLYKAQFPSTEDAGNLPAPIPQIFDSLMVLALAIEKAGTTENREAIRDALYEVSSPPGAAYGPAELAEALDAVRSGRDIDYTGAAGTFDIGENGDTALEVILFKVVGNGFETMTGLYSADLAK